MEHFPNFVLSRQAYRSGAGDLDGSAVQRRDPTLAGRAGPMSGDFHQHLPDKQERIPCAVQGSPERDQGLRQHGSSNPHHRHTQAPVQHSLRQLHESLMAGVCSTL